MPVKQIATFFLFLLISPWAAAIYWVGLVAREVLVRRARARRRNLNPAPTAEQRERFELAHQERLFRVDQGIA